MEVSWRKLAIWISLVFLVALIFIGIIVMVVFLTKTEEWPGKSADYKYLCTYLENPKHIYDILG